MAAFIAMERRAADPLVPVELFRSRMLRTGTAVALLGGASRASTFVLVALYFQQVLAMSPEQAGFAMVPRPSRGSPPRWPCGRECWARSDRCAAWS
jgi:hypothetical protein